LWGFFADHQVAISDAWISWGWDDESNPRIKPFGNLKMVHRAQGWDPKGGALLVATTFPRYSYHMYSVPVASQWLDYFEDQRRFAAALPEPVRRLLLVRLYSHDYGWCQTERWKDCFPDVQLDDGTISIAPLIEKSRLYISTYNSTTYLESLSLNVPTIMFWNPNHWELRDEAIPYFGRLKKAGIFHETPESAAAKVAEVWDDVPGWWYSQEIQAMRDFFCHRFSRKVDNPIRVLKETLSTART
jgi:putative transferase (TIGR04331 family)